MQAVTALAHLKAAILYMMDASEMCDRSLEQQIHLFEQIQPLFANKPVFVGLNKSDLMRRQRRRHCCRRSSRRPAFQCWS
jgi:nucleolar GTP-binding protein